jgi:hypothetical protein
MYPNDLSAGEWGLLAPSEQPWPSMLMRTSASFSTEVNVLAVN